MRDDRDLVLAGEGAGDAPGEDEDEIPEDDEASEAMLPLEATLAEEERLPWEEVLRAEARLARVVLWSSCSDSVSVLDWSRLRRQDSLEVRARV